MSGAGVAQVPAPSARRPYRIAVIALLACFALASGRGLVLDSPTVDEFAHLPSGWYMLATGDLSHFPLNPPLVKLWAALPLLALQPDLDTAPPAQPGGWYPWLYGTDFMERNRASFDRIFLFGRVPILLLGLALGVLVHRWARDLYGDAGGLLALALYAFCPTIAAHAHLATTDVGAAALIALALWTFDRWLRAPSLGRLVAAGLCLGLAQLAKLTALFLYPVLALLVLWAIARGEVPAGARARRLAGAVGIALASLVVLDCGYLFQGVGRPLSVIPLDSARLRALVAWLPAGLPSPLPAPYLIGLDNIALIQQEGELPGYLFGRWSTSGFALHYPVALLVKTTPAFLAALLASFWAGRARPAERALWLPAAVLLALFSLLSRLDYGVRYVLPVLPLLMIWCGRLAPWLARRGRFFQLAAVAIGLSLPVSAFLGSADGIGYFNLLAAGRGEDIVIDSNLDWGQGLKRLSTWMKAEGVEEIPLVYFGHTDPGIYGIRWHLPRTPSPGLIAVSVNFLHGYGYVTYLDGKMVPIPAGALTRLAELPRVAEPGGGIVVLRIGHAPPARGAS